MAVGNILAEPKQKVTPKSHYDTAHPQPQTNVPTKYQFCVPYGFQDIAWTNFKRSRSLR